MARTVRNAKLDTRSARAAHLTQRKAPYWHPISPGFALGYRKAPKGGVWLAKLVVPGRLRKETTIGPTDDAIDADGIHVLSFAQAQEKAREWKTRIERDQDGGPARPITVQEAIDSYEADLKARGGDAENVGRLRAHLSDHFLDKAVAALTWIDLRRWRDGLVRMPSGRKGRRALQSNVDTHQEKLSPATINRTCTVFKAVLNHVANDPGQRIASRIAWENGLESLPGAAKARNVILPDVVVRQIVAAAYEASAEFGLFVDVAAVTGARPIQIRRLVIGDLQADGAEPRLMMPSSKKGKKGVEKAPHSPVPITVDVAKRLQVAAAGRPMTAPLLTKPTSGNWRGGPWQDGEHDRPFDEIAERCKLQDWRQLGYPAKITIYALRHSDIVRQIRAGVPLRVIAATHDTSVSQIERHYSRFIADHTDAITRAALLDTSRPAAGNVFDLGGHRAAVQSG